MRVGDAAGAALAAPTAAGEREHGFVVLGRLDARGLRDRVRVLALRRERRRLDEAEVELAAVDAAAAVVDDPDELLGLVGRVADRDREAEVLEVLERDADVRDRDRVLGDAVVGRLRRLRRLLGRRLAERVELREAARAVDLERGDLAIAAVAGVVG